MPKINWTLDNLDEILSSLAPEQSAQVLSLIHIFFLGEEPFFANL